MKHLSCFVLFLCVLPLGASAVQTESWSWVAECQAYHAVFSGTSGVVCHFGDSITYSNPYSSWIRWGSGRTASDDTIRTWIHTNAGDTGQHRTPTDFANILSDWSYDGWYLAFQDNSLGGGSYTARSGIRTDQYLNGTYDLPTVEAMLDNYNPEIVVVMLGTNDASANRATQDMKDDLEAIIQHIIWQNGNTSGSYRGTIPIISTIPPKRADMTDVQNYNTAILDLAQTYHLPIIDFYGEIMDRQPVNWDGTLISADGIHPSASGGGYDASSDPYAGGGAALAQVGYLLRCFLSVQKIKDVKAQVIDGIPSTLTITTTTLPDGSVGSPYSQALSATGGTPPYSWAVTSGSLPAGLNLVAGVITGTPTTVETATFTVQVTDSVPATDTQVLTIDVTNMGPPVTVTLDPIKDTYIDSANATINYGSDTNMAMGGSYNGSPGWDRVSLLEFDLSSIPVGSTVTSATLTLWANNDTRGGNCSVQKVLHAWTEAGVTWNTLNGSTAWSGGNFMGSGNWENIPLGDAGGRTAQNYTDGSYTLSAYANGYPDSESPGAADNDTAYNPALDDWEWNETGGSSGIDFDVTDAVSDWVASGVNNGFAVCQPDKLTRDGGSTWKMLGFSNVTWFTKEFSTPGYAPTLSITYQVTAVDTTPPAISSTAAVLAGTVSDAGSTPSEVVINGSTSYPVTAGNWTTGDITIGSGTNDITVEATDASSNTRQVNVQIVVP